MRGGDLATLRYAAMLHDVGKVRVDRTLLTKLGKLDDAEIRALRLHAELALQVIDSFDFLKAAIPSIRHHHERWAGGGYPDGLIGEEIPLGSRIISVCETFDTLVSGAPWRTPETEGAALAELDVCSGTQFQPQVVAAFKVVQPLIQPVPAG